MLALLAGSAASAAAQETGTPIFKAPYRAFDNHEFGASLGAAVISSMAAASIAEASTDGFARGFTSGAVAAAAAALMALVLTPSHRAT